VTELLLVRHGETDWNRDRRIQGHTDVPLNETGRRQAEELAQTLARERVDAVYSSDLARAVQTARPVADRLGLEVETMPELRERDFGSWEGLTDLEIADRYPAHSGPWGDGETPDELLARLDVALREIAARHPGGRVVVVSHGGPIRRLLRRSGDDVGAIANCAVSRVAVEDGAVTRID
jgi:probable phosphoglycerate mutase